MSRKRVEGPGFGAEGFAMQGQWEAEDATPLSLRVFEVGVSLSVLILLAPVMALIAILVRRGTPGPALFSHKRLAIGARPFTFYKFRTTDQLAQVRLQEADDPRVTPQGKWLRRTSLDELPNFWHVLTGDMALVGPRPEMVEMLPYYTGEMLEKFSVRPGITGLAQVSGRGNLTFTETVKLDLEYVRTRSPKTDFAILLRTFLMVVKADGAL
jgi:lipopolysaccharide/colanic/teichoic acid biosynthesis glycosyltransferase